MRLFAALVPPPDVLDHLERAVESVLGPLRAGRAVRISTRENWHLTTSFFGEVPDGAVEELSAALGRGVAEAPPFRIGLAGAGVFGGRVLWIGVGVGQESMRSLMHATCDAAQEAGVAADRPERSRAHLTIARARGNPLLASAASALAVYRGPEWRAEDMVLLRSEPGKGRSGGSLYTELDRHPLRGGAADS